MSLPEIIRRARLAAELSQKDLAKRLGISKSAVCQWEKGAAAPGLATRVELAAQLQIRLSDLLPETKQQARVVTDPALVAIFDILETAQPELRASLLVVLGALSGHDQPLPPREPAKKPHLYALTG